MTGDELLPGDRERARAVGVWWATRGPRSTWGTDVDDDELDLEVDDDTVIEGELA